MIGAVRRARAWAQSWIDADVVRAYLAGMGTVHALIGLTWILIPSRGRELGVEWIPAVTPPLIGVLWVVTGTIAAVTAAAGASRAVAFSMLQGVPLLLAVWFGIAWLIALAPDTWSWLPVGAPGGITTTVSYLGLWLASACMGLVDAPREDLHG